MQCDCQNRNAHKWDLNPPAYGFRGPQHCRVQGDLIGRQLFERHGKLVELYSKEIREAQQSAMADNDALHAVDFNAAANLVNKKIAELYCPAIMSQQSHNDLSNLLRDLRNVQHYEAKDDCNKED